MRRIAPRTTSRTAAARRASVARALCALLLVASGALGAAQDGLPAEPAFPDPALWIHDPQRPIHEWLDKPPIDPDDLAARPGAYATVLATHGIALDLERRTVSVRGATLHDVRSLGYPIEYPVVTEIGKQHEALVLVRAWPSVIDACLRALGERPGASTGFVEKDPLPSMEEIESGKVSPYWLEPGHGPLFDIDMSWTDDDGRSHAAALESLFLDMHLDRELDVVGWIYTGSARGTYRRGTRSVEWFKADVEGDICAVYLEGLDVCLFERNSLDGLSYAPFTLNPARIPERGTPVTLRFTPRGEPVASRGRLDLRAFLLERDAARKARVAPDTDEAPVEPPVDEALAVPPSDG